VSRGGLFDRRRRGFARLAALVAVAVLVGLVLLPAMALARDSSSDAPALPTSQAGCFTDDSQSDFEAGTPNGCDLTSDPGSVQLSDAPPSVDQSNSTLGTSGVGITTTTWEGQTFKPNKTGQLTEVDVNLFCSGCTGTTPNLTLSIRATSGGLPTGADLASATIAGFSDGAAAYHTAAFASPITLTANTQYAFVVRPTTNPSIGTYALTRSGTSTAGSDVYSGGARVAGATSGTVWSIPLTGGVTTDSGFNIWIQAGHLASGTFVSSVKDADPPAGTTPTWTTLSFDATTPADTAVAFQVAASNSPTGPFNFIGPDGTPDTFFTTSGDDLSQFDGFRYLKYEAFLSTTDSSTSPSIQSVQTCFADLVAPSLAVAPVSGTEGGTVDLSATLTAGASGLPGKTIDFTLDGNSVGSAVTTADGTAMLQDVGLTGIGAGIHAGGVVASFAGDADDEPSSGSNTLTVIAVPTVSSTVDSAATGRAWAGTEVTGAAARDTATVTGDGGPPTGTVTYTRYDNATCSSPSAGTATVTLSGGSVPASAVTAALGAGSYSYQVTYSGDANYTARTTACEPFTVAKAIPEVVSVVDDASTGAAWLNTQQAGASAQDTSSIGGVSGFTPAGSVTYALYGDESCTGAALMTLRVAINPDGTVPRSTPTAALAAGSYGYQAAYSGDGNYSAATANCEPFTVASSSSGGGSGPTLGGRARPAPFVVSRITSRRSGVVKFHLTVQDAGVVNVLETARDNNLASVANVVLLNPAPHRFSFARLHLAVRRPRTVLVTVRPNARGRRLMAHHRYPVLIRLWVTYSVSGHPQGKQGFYGIPLSRKRPSRA
jgi:Bacterial Ig-like domain (group 3)